MAKFKRDDLVVAIRSATIAAGGASYRVTRDQTRMLASHPAVVTAPELFEIVGPSPGFETTSSPPGRTRGEKEA